VRVALAGDTMLGRGVARALEEEDAPLLAPEVVAAAAEADLFVLNLECCISDRGERWRDPRKPFFFRAPPLAAERLAELGVDCVTLANNHVLDYGPVALADTLAHLDAAGVAWVGAGRDAAEARRPRVLDDRLTVVAFSDHPRAYAAGEDRPGIAFAELGALPAWLTGAVAESNALVLAHWGPNMTRAPSPAIRAAARELRHAGAAFVAGHSAHVVHGVGDRVAYDLGDFVDDYAVDSRLRNDLGLLFLLELDEGEPVALEAVPLKLDFCFTRLAEGGDADWISNAFISASAGLDTTVERRGGRLYVSIGAHDDPG
jgi:poly-gamma-glutamate capsule biosynthesis protein CapA/YwtB (metallophosphatase superfamily)